MISNEDMEKQLKEAYPDHEFKVDNIDAKETPIENKRVVPDFMKDKVIYATKDAKILNDGKTTTYYRLTVSYSCDNVHHLCECAYQASEEEAINDFIVSAGTIIKKGSIGNR